jgi:hypothetical protein
MLGKLHSPVSTAFSHPLVSMQMFQLLISQHLATGRLSERNLFSTQNAQFWKLIEKHRVGYSQLLKEVERMRAERIGGIKHLVRFFVPARLLF